LTTGIILRILLVVSDSHYTLLSSMLLYERDILKIVALIFANSTPWKY